MNCSVRAQDIYYVRHCAIGTVEISIQIIYQYPPMFAVTGSDEFGCRQLFFHILMRTHAFSRMRLPDIHNNEFNVRELIDDFLHVRDVFGVHGTGGGSGFDDHPFSVKIREFNVFARFQIGKGVVLYLIPCTRTYEHFEVIIADFKTFVIVNWLCWLLVWHGRLPLWF